MTGRTNEYYSSPEEVIKIAKIDRVDFDCDTDEELEKYIITILKDGKSIIDEYTKKTFETVPEAIHGVARDYCLNVLANARTISQLNGDLSNYTSYPKSSAIFTQDLRDRLDIVIGTMGKDASTVKVRVFGISIKKEDANEEI